MEEEKTVLLSPAESEAPQTDTPPVSLPEASAAPAASPEAQPAADEVLRLEQEVTALRQERLRRLMLEEAKSGLEERGIAAGFAPFLLGDDPADTRRRLEQFEREYHRALRAQLAPYLGGSEPRDFSVTHTSRRRPGIRKLS